MESQMIVWVLICVFFAIVAIETRHDSLFVIAMVVCLLAIPKLSNGYVMIATALMLGSYSNMRSLRSYNQQQLG